MKQSIKNFKQSALTKSCPHCEHEMNFFLSKELMKNAKIKTCSACDKNFKVDIDYKVLAITALPIAIGVVIIGTLMFGQSQIIMMGSGIIGAVLGFANGSTLSKI